MRCIGLSFLKFKSIEIYIRNQITHLSLFLSLNFVQIFALNAFQFYYFFIKLLKLYKISYTFLKIKNKLKMICGNFEQICGVV